MPIGSKKSSPAGDVGETSHEIPDIVRHLTEQLRTLDARAPLGVAVSGGGDSMALVRLLAEAAPDLGFALSDIRAVTVDHGLRPEAADEARTVRRWMKALGISHQILHCGELEAGPGLQAAARQVRYALILEWCLHNGVRTLLTAHTADDHAETVLMRLARGSGVDGLSGIARQRVLEAPDGTRVRLLRPLLQVQREQLRLWLQSKGADWLDDPSNENRAFDRIKARQALALLEPLGLSRERLVKTAARMACARKALEDASTAVEADAVHFHSAGFAWLDPAILGRQNGEISLRVLSRVLMAVSGAAYRPRLERLERTLSALEQGTAKGRTLGGCRLIPQKDGQILVCRELRAAAPPIPLEPGAIAVWDGRFRVRLASGMGSGELGAAGAEGLRQLRTIKEFDPTGIPPPARSSLPCFFRHGRAVAAPHIGIRMDCLEVERLDPGDTSLLRFLNDLTTPRLE